MVEWLASLFGGTNKYPQVVQHLLLSSKAVEPLGAERTLHLAFLRRLAVTGSI
jgi:hypothetical protein